MKRASYRQGVFWIAANDNSGSRDTLADVAGYVSTLLLADLFAFFSLLRTGTECGTM